MSSDLVASFLGEFVPRFIRNMAYGTGGCWLLSGLGFVLALTVAPDAINMALGAGIVALVMTPVVIWAWRDVVSGWKR